MKTIFLFLVYFSILTNVLAQDYGVPQFTVNNRTYDCKVITYSAYIANSANQSKNYRLGVTDGGSPCGYQIISKNVYTIKPKIKALFTSTRYAELKSAKTKVSIGVYAPRTSGVIHEVAFVVDWNCKLTYQELYAIEDAIKGLDLLTPVPDCNFQYNRAEIFFDF